MSQPIAHQNKPIDKKIKLSMNSSNQIEIMATTKGHTTQNSLLSSVFIVVKRVHRIYIKFGCRLNMELEFKLDLMQMMSFNTHMNWFSCVFILIKCMYLWIGLHTKAILIQSRSLSLNVGHFISINFIAERALPT